MRWLITLTAIGCVVGGFTSAATANLLLDFNSTSQDDGPHPEAGYESYDAGHEEAADFVTMDYSVTFPIAGAATVSVTPAWPNTTANTVMQMIDRTAGFDANWVGNKLDLLTDWIGSDSRTGNGGNGDWDRTGGTTATYMTISLGGLPAGTYDWLSYHHDTEYMWADFQVEVSTDGGVTYGAATDLEITPSSATSTPPAPVQYTGSPDPDPRNLPSTLAASFDADGVNDVVVRFAPFVDGIDPTGVHKQFFAMNGFELTQVPEPSTLAVLCLCLGGLIGLRRWRR